MSFLNYVVGLLTSLPKYIPGRVKPLIRPLSPVYQGLIKVISSLGSEEPVRTEWGPLILVDYSKPIERRIAHNTFEPVVVEHFVNYLSTKNNVNFADIGANIGLYSTICAYKSPGNQVDAFEPVPSTVSRIKRNLELNDLGDRVSVYEIGLLNELGTKQITVSSTNIGEASFTEKLQTSPGSEQLLVGVSTLDKFYENREPPDVIKIDVEGAELRVLQGGEKLIKSHRPDLFIEIHPQLVTQFGYSISDLAEYLKQTGFTEVYHIESGNYIGFNELAEYTESASEHFYIR